LLPSTDLHGAHTVAEMIRQNVMDQRIPHSKNIEGIVTVSIGTYTQIPDLDENLPYKWVGFADEALYRAKANGRNRIETTHAPATRIHLDNVGI
jgi:diguanylate cyclase (GGDEF)-like protein